MLQEYCDAFSQPVLNATSRDVLPLVCTAVIGNGPKLTRILVWRRKGRALLPVRKYGTI